jgi:hypothetical protein
MSSEQLGSEKLDLVEMIVERLSRVTAYNGMYKCWSVMSGRDHVGRCWPQKKFTSACICARCSDTSCHRLAADPDMFRAVVELISSGPTSTIRKNAARIVEHVTAGVESSTLFVERGDHVVR